MPNFAEYRYEPLRGPATLIIGPFNYPFQLTLIPAAGSLSAGNPTVIKPSELCKATSKLLATLIPKYFQPGILQGTGEYTYDPLFPRFLFFSYLRAVLFLYVFCLTLLFMDTVIQGSVATTTLLLEREWGLVFFTGSPKVSLLLPYSS